MSIGYKLKTLREQKKITRKNLAEKINVSTTTIARYENGDRSMNYDTLCSILKILCDSETEFVAFFYSLYYDLTVSSENKLEELMGLAIELKAKGDAWKNEYMNIEREDKYLLNSIFRYLEFTEDYFPLYHIKLNDNASDIVPYLSDSQINSIINKVTDLVKYEMYKIENDK